MKSRFAEHYSGDSRLLSRAVFCSHQEYMTDGHAVLSTHTHVIYTLATVIDTLISFLRQPISVDATSLP